MTKKLGRRLESLRTSKGLTQQQVATKIRVDNSWLSRLEDGKLKLIDAVKLHRLARFYGSSSDELLGEQEPQVLATELVLSSSETRVLAAFRAVGAPVQEAVASMLEAIASDESSATPRLRVVRDQTPAPGFARLRLLGRLAAGRPIEGPRGPDEIDIPVDLLPHGCEAAAAEVEGDSMDQAGIPDGSVIAYCAERAYATGSIVVVRVRATDEHTVKRWRRARGRVTLSPVSSNPENQPLAFGAEEVEVMGVVAAVCVDGEWRKVDGG